MMQANLSLSTLLEMVDRREIGEDGTLNEYHYMSFMLVRSGLVPVETLQSLHENFRMLDADGVSFSIRNESQSALQIV